MKEPWPPSGCRQQFWSAATTIAALMAGCINPRGMPGGITLYRLLVDLMTLGYFTSMPAEGILD